MGRLQYAVICSLDGELHAAVNDLERPVGTYLYGRAMYETLAVWQTIGGPDVSAIENDYADIWRAAGKIVYSTTLEDVSTPRTRLERRFDPEVVRGLVAEAERDVSIGGPGLAAHALRAGLVDDVHQFLHPIVVGGGTPVFPHGVRQALELVAERRFGSGVVHLHHRVR
jgi:dihydrofolate reductase